MGYKNEIFEEQVDDELKCPICEKVLENPMQGVNCEHLFCLDCIQQWLKTSLVCPLDRKPLLKSQLHPPPKVILRLLSNLKIKCHFYDYGCLIGLKLSELNSHLQRCLHNPRINQNVKKIKVELNGATQNMNELKHFRIAGDLSGEISEINKKVNELNQYLELENRKSMEFAKNLEIAQHNYNNLSQKFKCIVNPFLKIIKNNNENQFSSFEEDYKLDEANEQITNEQPAISNEDRQICTVIIRNLDEFLNEKIVEEYLRQNEITILSCELELTIFRRSRDFKVTLYKSDLHKIFRENLWPTGSICHNLSSSRENQIIFGKRQNDLPCFLIKSGLALSYY